MSAVNQIRKCADALKKDMDGSQSAIDYYRNLVANHSVQYIAAKEFFALRCQNVTVQEFIEAIKIALLETNAVVTDNYRVDQYDNVYDEKGIFYCKWEQLTDEEKETVKDNPFSAR